jgi:3-methyladenine DNA glycosylase AlkC
MGDKVAGKAGKLAWDVLDSCRPLPPIPKVRKGSITIAAIPKDVRAALNEGRIEAATLVEWLSIDMGKLLDAAFRHAQMDAQAAVAEVEKLHGEKFNTRLKLVAGVLHRELRAHRSNGRAIVALSQHPSDMVRGWVAFTHGMDEAGTLEERLRVARFFAADRSMAVRECAWDAIRPHLARDLSTGIGLLGGWVADADPNVRRCAIEATRPRGVWCAHIEELKARPELALPLLEVVRSDPSRYVAASAANWLNDASKTQPQWVQRVCARWAKESKTPETAWLVARALRTLRKGEEAPAPKAPRSRRAKG